MPQREHATFSLRWFDADALDSRPMKLHIYFDGLWDWEVKASIESTLRACIGEPPANEEWSVLVISFRDFCTVRVQTPKQIQSKLFLLQPPGLSRAIAAQASKAPGRSSAQIRLRTLRDFGLAAWRVKFATPPKGGRPKGPAQRAPADLASCLTN